MKKIIVFIYGILSYLLFLGTILFAIGFLNNTVVPTGIDEGVASTIMQAFLIDLGLIALFGLAHSVMARKRFKVWWTRMIPKAAERSTYVLQSSLLLLLIFWQWRPIPNVIWSVENDFGSSLVQVVHLLGWVIAVVATFLINHFHFTGLQQVHAHLLGKKAVEPNFRTPFLYKMVRHPLQMGLLIAFWVTADMTVGRLLFATAMTVYILIGLYFEERDMVRQFGKDYIQYRRTTPKLLPKIPTNA